MEDYQKQFLEGKDKFENIFKLTSAASKIIAPDLTILRVNQALIELLGFAAHEIEGTKILDYSCPEYIEHWRKLQKAMWEEHQPFFKLEACLFRKDKSLAWVSVTTVLFHENDSSYGFTVLDDITWRKDYEQSEKRLNIALQYSKTAVWEMNLNTHNVIRSDSHDSLFGYDHPLDSWNSESYITHLLPEFRTPLENEIRNLSIGDFFDFQGKILLKSGEIKWIHLQGKTEQAGGEATKKLLGTIKDITKEKIAERHKDEFISTVSHELKTPITSIKAQAQILERRFLAMDDKVTTLMLKRIILQIGRLNILIKDLLDAGRLDEQKLFLRKEDFMFNEMVEETVAEIQRTTTHQLIIRQNPVIYCSGDRERTSQVLSNLLTNAIKYSPSKNKVIITTEEKEDQIICSVEDFGIGIAADKQPYIFERFYRVSGMQERVISGFGLGLYISSEIINRLEGKIWLRSKPGKGSVFYFSISKGK